MRLESRLRLSGGGGEGRGGLVRWLRGNGARHLGISATSPCHDRQMNTLLIPRGNSKPQSRDTLNTYNVNEMINKIKYPHG